MSDLTPGFPAPPPPPPNAPPPVYHQPPGYAHQPPGYAPYSPQLPGYLPPQQPVYSSGWTPPQAPQPYLTAAVAAGGAGALLYQFGGVAAWSIGCGLVAIVIPFVSGFYYPLLPVVGGINAYRAIQRGRLLGGVVGIGVNILGGLVSLLAYLSTR
jgi:hypothetical protein